MAFLDFWKLQIWFSVALPIFLGSEQYIQSVQWWFLLVLPARGIGKKGFFKLSLKGIVYIKNAVWEGCHSESYKWIRLDWMDGLEMSGWGEVSHVLISCLSAIFLFKKLIALNERWQRVNGGVGAWRRSYFHVPLRHHKVEKVFSHNSPLAINVQAFSLQRKRSEACLCCNKKWPLTMGGIPRRTSWRWLWGWAYEHPRTVSWEYLGKGL